MPDTIRAFVAIELPCRVIASIAEIQDRLKKHGFNIRWVRPGNIHLTLKFLGNIESGTVEKIGDAVSRAVNDSEPLSLEVAGLGVFPNMHRPRVVWVGISGDTGGLQVLQKKVDSRLLSVGFPEEARLYKGHLTLGRVKGALPMKRFQLAFDRCRDFYGGAFLAHELILFKSDLKPTGSEYTKLWKMRIS